MDGDGMLPRQNGGFCRSTDQFPTSPREGEHGEPLMSLMILVALLVPLVPSLYRHCTVTLLSLDANRTWFTKRSFSSEAHVLLLTASDCF